ncbi:MAG: hypothetical protein PHG64_13875 [Paludibacter sp.]|nr:hypothetical protein [Paludibacter sp.]
MNSMVDGSNFNPFSFAVDLLAHNELGTDGVAVGTLSVSTLYWSLTAHVCKSISFYPSSSDGFR